MGKYQIIEYEVEKDNHGKYFIMNDQVVIVLIIVVAVVVVLVVFRNKLSRFGFKTKNLGANLETHKDIGINITKTSQKK